MIGGTAGGRKLTTPKGSRVRPTSDRVKEALFSILVSRLGTFAGCRVLDLFAGTGSLGIEALSRGAEEALFVDSHKDSVALVKKNLAMLGMTERARVLERDVVTAVRGLGREGAPYGLVFADPPYRQGLAVELLGAMGDSAVVDRGSVIIVETSADEALPTVVGNLAAFDRRVYGDTAVVFYRLSSDDGADANGQKGSNPGP